MNLNRSWIFLAAGVATVLVIVAVLLSFGSPRPSGTVELVVDDSVIPPGEPTPPAPVTVGFGHMNPCDVAIAAAVLDTPEARADERGQPCLYRSGDVELGISFGDTPPEEAGPVDLEDTGALPETLGSSFPELVTINGVEARYDWALGEGTLTIVGNDGVLRVEIRSMALDRTENLGMAQTVAALIVTEAMEP